MRQIITQYYNGMRKVWEKIKDILFNPLCILFCIGLCIPLSIIFAQELFYGHKCVVIETGYYHSTNKESKCKFIASAKKHGYTIKKMGKDEAIDKGYNICHYCFSKDEQELYNDFQKMKNDLKKQKERYEKYKDEDLGWESLPYKKDYDFSKLYVYIDKELVLHISATCLSFDIDSANKVRFDDVDSISSTCEDCVERRFCDFIYKKVYEGVYDSSQIKEEEDEEDDYFGY